MEEFLQTCGYIASYFGTILEGEILLITAVVTAKMGYMNIYGALTAVFAGAYTRDWMTFLLARKKGKEIIEKKPKLQAKLSKVNNWMIKNPELLLSVYRLLFGFATVIVLLAGTSNLSMKKFGILSAISCALWTMVYGSLAYFCADALLSNIEFVSQNKGYVIAGLSMIGLGYWFFVKRKELKLSLKNIK